MARRGDGDDTTSRTPSRRLMISTDNPASSAFRYARPEAEETGLVGGADPSRRFVPSSVLPVLQLAENTAEADGLLSRMPGVRVPPGAPTLQCLQSLSRHPVAIAPRGG